MAEMLVVLVALVPLWLGLLAFAGLQDVATTTQAAARYAAFDAALSPESAGTLASRVRRHVYDTSRGAVAAVDAAPRDTWVRYPGLWVDPASNRRWLAAPSSVSIAIAAEPLGGLAGGASRVALAAVAPAAPLAPGRFDLRPSGLSQAIVRSEAAMVSLPFLPRPLRFEARVGVLGDAWAADDSRQAASRVGGAAPLRVLVPVTAVIAPLTPLLGLLEPTLREFCPGVIAPDVVPADRLVPRPVLSRREYVRC
ncbi:MAG: hypothetical protein AB7G76_05655 [Steroidobacteraceae bacterium]